jgi:hypothetical protein
LSHKAGRRRYERELTKIRQSLPDAWEKQISDSPVPLRSDKF